MEIRRLNATHASTLLGSHAGKEFWTALKLLIGKNQMCFLVRRQPRGTQGAAVYLPFTQSGNVKLAFHQHD